MSLPAQLNSFPDAATHGIYEQFRRGESISTLAKRYGCGGATIRRMTSQVRARRIVELPLDYVHSDEFEKPEAEDRILVPMPDSPQRRNPSRLPAGLPFYLASLYEVPLLTREQEHHLFRKLNYLKHTASRLRDQLDPSQPGATLMERIEALCQQAVNTRNDITRANLRLVVSSAKRYRSPTRSFDELISDGNMSLMGAVDRFDYARGNKFSSYAFCAIMRNHRRATSADLKLVSRFRTGCEERLDIKRDLGACLRQQAAHELRQRQVGRVLSCLNERERKIIVGRFGLDCRREPQTLSEIGEELHVTKQRVHQLEAQAMDKLRDAACRHRIQLLEPPDHV